MPSCRAGECSLRSRTAQIALCPRSVLASTSTTSLAFLVACRPGWASTPRRSCRGPGRLTSVSNGWQPNWVIEPKGVAFKEILYVEEGPIGTITLNRPNDGNMFTETMCHEIRDCIESIRRETRTRVII